MGTAVSALNDHHHHHSVLYIMVHAEVVIGQVVENNGQEVEGLPLFLIFGFLSVSSAHLGHQNQNLQKLQIFRKISQIFANFGQFSPFLVIWVCLLSILARKMKIFDFVVKKLSFWVRALRARGPSGPSGPSGPLVQVHLLTHLSLRIS